MNTHTQLVTTIGATKQSILDARDALRKINEPIWQHDFGAILDQADTYRHAHNPTPQPSVANDYANLAGLLRQVHFSDEDQDRERFRALRGARGSLLEDVREILNSAGKLGVRPTQPVEQLPDMTMLEVSGREGQLISLENRIYSVEKMLTERLESEATSDKPRKQVIIVSQYIKDMRRYTSSIRSSITVGGRIDIAVVERAASAMGRATVAMIDTVRARASNATQSLRDAMMAIGKPVRKLASGVGVLIRLVRRAEGRFGNSPPPAPLPKNYRIQAKNMILIGKIPPAHWIPYINDLNFTNCDISDVSLLSTLSGLQRLYLSNTKINHVNSLVNLVKIQRLNLANTFISDISPLFSLKNLESLDISDTNVSDISPLSALPSLRKLNLRYTNISDIESLSDIVGLTIFVESTDRASALMATLKARSLVIVEQRIGI